MSPPFCTPEQELETLAATSWPTEDHVQRSELRQEQEASVSSRARRKLPRMSLVAALLGLCTLIFFLRLHTYEEPLERDLTTYAVIAHEMLNGKNLYSDLWDHKPPAIHVTYATAELIAGYGRDSIFLMNVVAAFATLFACYLAGSANGRGPASGLVAAALWTLASGDLAIEGNQPNTEIFLNALLATAFAFFARSEKTNLGKGGALLVGLFFAAASLYKQIVVVQAALLAIAYLATSPAEARKKAIADVCLIVLVGAITWALVFGYFFAQGRGQAFIDAVFIYNRFYPGLIRHTLNHAPVSWTISMGALAVLLSFGILSGVGIVLGLIFGPRRGWILLLAFVIATHIAVRLPGWCFPHYYQLWLPPLAIGAGWAVALLRRTLPLRFSWLSYSVAGISVAILITLEVPYYRLPAKAWSVAKYGDIFVETEQLATRIDKLLPPGATFYEWGNETGLYFTTGRRPPSGIIFAYPLQAGPIAAQLSHRLLGDLQRDKPDLVIAANETLRITPQHPVLRWLEQNYQPFSRTRNFVLLARKGGELDRRKTIATTH